MLIKVIYSLLFSFSVSFVCIVPIGNPNKIPVSEHAVDDDVNDEENELESIKKSIVDRTPLVRFMPAKSVYVIRNVDPKDILFHSIGKIFKMKDFDDNVHKEVFFFTEKDGSKKFFDSSDHGIQVIQFVDSEEKKDGTNSIFFTFAVDGKDAIVVVATKRIEENGKVIVFTAREN